MASTFNWYERAGCIWQDQAALCAVSWRQPSGAVAGTVMGNKYVPVGSEGRPVGTVVKEFASKVVVIVAG